MALSMVSSLRMAATKATLTGLAGCNQLLIEGLDGRVVDSGAHGGHVEGASDVGPTAPYGMSSPMATTVTVQGSDTDKGGDLPTVEGAEFGESADEGEGGNGVLAGDISEEEELVLPEDVRVNSRSFISRSRSSSS